MTPQPAHTAGPKKANQIFWVYFAHVNQTKFEIRSKTKEQAIETARQEWTRSYGDPKLVEVAIVPVATAEGRG